MKTLVLCLTILCFFSCKKEDMQATHPEYSFVRLDDTGFTIPPCQNDIDKCLPIQELEDLRFQLVTDYNDGGGIHDNDFFNITVAIPCDDCTSWTAAQIYAMIFDDDLPIKSTSVSSSGKLIVRTEIEFATQAQYIGWVFLTGTGAHEGFFKVLSYQEIGDDVLLTLDVLAGAPVTVGNRISAISNTMIIADASQIGTSGEYFAGSNYSWEFSKPMNPLSRGNTAYLPQNAYTTGECVSFCIWRVLLYAGGLDMPIFQEGTCLGRTNCFEVVDSSCYTTKILYGCNEADFGFYGQGWANSIRLPMYFSRPNYDSDEKGYQRSDGLFVKLAERVNKTFELRTDWMPSEWHDRLRVALSCDTIQVTNENENLTQVSIYKKDEYEVDWDSEIDYPLAKGKAKVFKGLFRKSVNSNCV